MMLFAVTMLCAASCTKQKGLEASGSFNGHDYVDLGLPSGTLWATCNIGAASPEEYGDYFAWGETEPKTTYDWENYKYNNGDECQLTKYCNNSAEGYNGFTDTLTMLQPNDDAATVNWGYGWSMPTKEQWEELIDNTSGTVTRWNGVRGNLFTATNGNSIFLPYACHYEESGFISKPKVSYYWSSSLNEELCGFALYFWDWLINEASYRSEGLSVRPVCFALK